LARFLRPHSILSAGSAGCATTPAAANPSVTRTASPYIPRRQLDLPMIRAVGEPPRQPGHEFALAGGKDLPDRHLPGCRCRNTRM
jgi:hypothetical protein